MKNPGTISQEFLVNRTTLSIIAASFVVAGTLGAAAASRKEGASENYASCNGASSRSSTSRC